MKSAPRQAGHRLSENSFYSAVLNLSASTATAVRSLLLRLHGSAIRSSLPHSAVRFSRLPLPRRCEVCMNRRAPRKLSGARRPVVTVPKLLKNHSHPHRTESVMPSGDDVSPPSPSAPTATASPSSARGHSSALRGRQYGSSRRRTG